MRIGACTGIGGLKSGVPGLEYIEPTVGDLLCPAEAETVFQQRLAAVKAGPLPAEAVNVLFPGQLKTTGPAVDAAAVDAWMEATCRRAAACGVQMIVFGSGGSRRVPDGFDRRRASGQLVEHLKRFGPIAARHGVTVVLEPLSRNDSNIVNSADEGAELVRAAGHPNVRLLVDTYHMAVDGEGPESIRRAGGLIAHAHCAERDGRGPLGTTGEDQRAYFRALKDVGYAGRISIEARWNDLAAQLPAAVAELRRQWEAA